MSWSINAPFPNRLVQDQRVMDLTDRDARVLDALYHGACDQEGRFILSESGLRISTGLVTGKPLVPSVRRLAALGLVLIYPDPVQSGRTIAQLEGYDDDLTARQREKRAPSKLPESTPSRGNAGGSQGGNAGGKPAPVSTTSRGSRGGNAGGSGGGSQGGNALPPSSPPSPSFPPTPPLSPTPTPPPPEAAESAARVGAGAGERAPAYAPPRESYPDAKAAAAADRWTRHIRQLAPTLSVGDESLVPLALEVGSEVFVRAVELHFDSEAQFWRKYPLKALRERCRWAAERIAEERAAPAPRAPSQGRQQWPPPAPAAAASAPAAAPDRSHLPVVERRVVISELCPNDGCVALRNWLKGQREPRDVQRLESVVATVIEPQPGAPHLSTFREASWRELSEPDRDAILAAFPAYEQRMSAPRKRA